MHFPQGVVPQVVRDDASAHRSGHPDHGLLVRGESPEHLLRILHQWELLDWFELPIEGSIANIVEL